jgi:hypothetical protein
MYRSITGEAPFIITNHILSKLKNKSKFYIINKTMLKDFNYIVVGIGISGATIAERTTNELKKPVLFIEKRDYIGSNYYDYYDKHGVLVPKYEPHFFKKSVSMPIY